jgi:imidazoleglycerol-phosphate dehydratase
MPQWEEIMSRRGEIVRTTRETDISLKLELDGTGLSDIDSGIGFLDHMLVLMAHHGRMDVSLSCRGDLEADCHHTAEDIGIVLGQALSSALGAKAGIVRYGTAHVPMDETLVRVSLDLSGRPYLSCSLPFTAQRLGTLDTEMVCEFFRAVTQHGGITLHVDCLRGSNNHHMAEAAFKAFGRALLEAAAVDPTVQGVPSTKGLL